MATCPEVKAVYEETIKTFTFRDSDGISIPKAVRQEAYILAVDIVIVSTASEVYKNYSTTPAEGFYGNATLVMQDMCERKIPVSMPRQRIYYGRVPEAFAIWQSLVDWSYFQAYMTALGETLQSLGAALGVGALPEFGCCSLPDRSWVELPLREVFFNCRKGTQYKIEASWWKALQIQDYCGDIRDPRSKQQDGDKDDGLPPNGVQPSVAENPNNPFQNLPPSTPNSEQGSWSSSKGEDGINNPSPLDNIDPDNLPFVPPNGSGTYIYYSWTAIGQPPASVPPTGFPEFVGSFLFDEVLSNVYTVGDRCGGGIGYLYYKNGSLVGCAQASGYRLEHLSFERFT